MYKLLLSCIVLPYYMYAAHLDSTTIELLPLEIKNGIIQQAIKSYTNFWELIPFFHSLNVVNKQFNQLVGTQQIIHDISDYFKVPPFNSALATGNKSYISYHENLIRLIKECVPYKINNTMLAKLDSNYVNKKTDPDYAQCEGRKIVNFLWYARTNFFLMNYFLNKQVNPNSGEVAMTFFRKIFSEEECYLGLKLFCQHTFNVNTPRTLNLNTLLMRSIKKRWTKVTALLLVEGMDPNLQNIEGKTVLHLLASYKDNKEHSAQAQEKIVEWQKEAIHMLLAKGADKTICDYNGKLPSDCTTNAAIEKLLQCNANDVPHLYQSSNQHNTSLHYQYISANVSQSLLAQADNKGYIPLHDYAQNCQIKVIESIFDKWDISQKKQYINHPTIYGQTPLHMVLSSIDCARAENLIDTIQLLINNGANPALKDYSGRKAIYYLSKSEKLTSDQKEKISSLLEEKISHKRKREDEQESSRKCPKIDL